MSTDAPNIVVALDYSDPDQARRFVAQLPTDGCCLKVGKELFVSGGPGLVEAWVKAGWRVFLDLKFHDIPHTVAAACRAATDLGVWMIDVHALGGTEMLEAARDAVREISADRPLLVAVTVLTSHHAGTLSQIGLNGTPEQAVSRLAHLAYDVGLDGVVCSGNEVSDLRQSLAGNWRFVTPGIRPRGSEKNDQKRVMTPEAAVQAGATDLVIGRPITNAADPAKALAQVQSAIHRTDS